MTGPYSIFIKFSFKQISGTKYTLLDNPQKDRIIYLKPNCINILLSEFEASESISNSIQFSKLSTNVGLRKILSRSLDLLRHDKIESFNHLADQLKYEYKITCDNDFEGVNAALSDTVFKNLIQRALMTDKILLRLDLDKTNSKPHEEVIEFNNPRFIQNVSHFNLTNY